MTYDQWLSNPKDYEKFTGINNTMTSDEGVLIAALLYWLKEIEKDTSQETLECCRLTLDHASDYPDNHTIQTLADQLNQYELGQDK